MTSTRNIIQKICRDILIIQEIKLFQQYKLHTHTHNRFTAGLEYVRVQTITWPKTGALPGQKMWGGHAYRARGARAYNGVWEWSPSGVQGQSLWSGVKGKAPWSWKPFSFWCSKFASFSEFCKLLNANSQPPSSRVKTHRICINLRNDLWQKWGWLVHPSPPGPKKR